MPLTSPFTNIITGLKGYALLRAQMIAQETGTPLSGQEAADIVRGTDMAADLAKGLLTFYATLPVEAGIALGSAATVVKFGQTAGRVKRVHTSSGTIVRSGKGWRRVAGGAGWHESVRNTIFRRKGEVCWEFSV